MKCPHCAVGIHESFVESVFINEAQINSSDGAKVLAPVATWRYFHLRCPECYHPVLYLQRQASGFGVYKRFLAYPSGYIRPVAPEVIDRIELIL